MSMSINYRFVTGVALGLAIFLTPALSQQQGGQGQPQTPPGGDRGTQPSPTPTPPGRQPFPGTRDQNPPFGQDQRSPFPEQQRPIFLSGKVTLDDGTPPPDSVIIERVCNGIARPEGYTDSKGRFSFQLGQNQAVMQDASYGSSMDASMGGRNMGGFGTPGRGMDPRGGISERELMGCELRAVLAGYRSDLVNLSTRRAFDDPNVGTIVLHRLGNVEGTTISATSLEAPKDAKKAYEKARNALRKNKLDDAEKELRKAVEIYPKYAVAWYDLGTVQQQHNQFDEARKCYEQALAADSRYINPYLQMAVLAARENKWKDVADTTDRAIKLNPVDFPQAFFYNSVANYNLRNLDAAERSAREAQKLDSQHRFPKINHLLGIILSEKRDYAGAAEQMRSYLKFAPTAQDAGAVRTQLAEIEKLSGSAQKGTPNQ